MQLTTFDGQPALAIRAPDGAQATVLLRGAHLVSWIPAGGEEQLYMSPTARHDGQNAVRGGVPVVFPQFNERGPLQRHGLVRTRTWEATESVVRGAHALGVLRFTDNDETRATWPVSFEAELTVSIAGSTLEIEFAATNTGDRGFDFTAALHTYLRTNDALKLQLEGLQNHEFEDALNGGEVRRQWGDVLTVVGPVDRVYHEVQRSLTLRELGRRVEISQQGFEDVVVWNPGSEAKLADMPAGDWQRMICVEAACVQHPVHLPAGETWTGMQTLVAG